MKATLKVLGGLLAIGIVLAGSLIAVNATDENPSPAFQQLLNLPTVAVEPPNAFEARIGLLAPAGENPLQYGRRWVDTFNAAEDKATIDKAMNAFELFDKPGSGPRLGDRLGPELGTLKPPLCDSIGRSCIGLVGLYRDLARKSDSWTKFEADNSLLLERLAALMRLQRYEESYFPPTIYSPQLYFSMDERGLRVFTLDLIMQEAAAGEIAPALEHLEERTAADRRAFVGSASDTTYRAAAEWLALDFGALMQIVALRPAGLDLQRERLLRLTAPITNEEVRPVLARIAVTSVRERVHRTQGLFKTPDDVDLLQRWWLTARRLFFQPNATANLYAEDAVALQAIASRFSADSLNARSDEVIAHDASRENDLTGWRRLYNPEGKWAYLAVREEQRILHHNEVEEFLPSVDIASASRLARLQAMLFLDNVANTDIPARLVAERTLYDPYTGKPMLWDAAKRQLSATTLRVFNGGFEARLGKQ